MASTEEKRTERVAHVFHTANQAEILTTRNENKRCEGT